MSSASISELPVASRLNFDDDDVIHQACDEGPRNAAGTVVACCGFKFPPGVEDTELFPDDIVCPLCPMIPDFKCACYG